MVMARDSYEMQEEFKDELSKSDVALGGLRYIAEAVGLPTDTESIEAATRGIPVYAFTEAVSDGRLSELLEGIGEGASVEELISSVTDLPVEEAALAATAMGAMSPGGRFKSMREGLEAIIERLLSKEKNPDKSEMDLLREQGATPSELSRSRPSSAYFSPRNRVERGTESLAEDLDAYDLGLTDELPTGAFQKLYTIAERKGVDIDDLIQEIRQSAIPTRPRSRYYEEYKNPTFPSDETNPDFLDPIKQPDRRAAQTQRHRTALVKQHMEDEARIAQGLPPRDTAFTRRNRGLADDQMEIDFNQETQEGGLPSIFNMLEDSMNPRSSEAGLDAALRGLDKDLDAARRSGTMPKGSSEFDPIPRGENAAMIDSLRAQLNQENLEPETVRRYTRELERLLRDSDVDPDLMATGGRPGLYANIHAKRKRIAAGSGERMRRKGEEGAPTAENFRQAAKTEKKNMGGRPGTRRRKKIMVPASYKTGGQVFQKGYYGKSYK
jgi:hypothetical protein